MKNFLDKLYGNTRPAMAFPLFTAVVAYLLFAFFGVDKDTKMLLIAAPIVSVILFFMLFFMIYIQIKNTSCPEWFLNLCELLFTIFSFLMFVRGIFPFFFSGFEDFLTVCFGCVAFSAIAWAHSKRKQ
ncbi:MAG: hypothetical protein IKK70_01225 [Clostridia bacterium]|nr:hypothetical protein [Clostridia bacterium]MBR6784155.1 hypothetical protein [Clostridia bacterium]